MNKQRAPENKYDLRSLIFLALCCNMGLFTKRLIAPAANMITDFLRIPGGIGTAFSLMFLVIAAMAVKKRGCATIMGAVQSVIALSFGMVGSMGALSPIGYIIPGAVIDSVIWAAVKLKAEGRLAMAAANMAGAAAASLSANAIVFNLRGLALALYVAVALASGAVCGVLGYSLLRRIEPALTAGLAGGGQGDAGDSGGNANTKRASSGKENAK